MDKIKPGNDRKLSARQRNNSPAARQAVDAALRKYALSALRRPRKNLDSPSDTLDVRAAVAQYLANELLESGLMGNQIVPTDDETNALYKSADKTHLSTPFELGLRIRAARKRQGVTQQELADLSGLSLGSIKSLEAGGNVGIQHVFTVLAVVGIRLYTD